jgi:phosphate transport system substrate-binding protein
MPETAVTAFEQHFGYRPIRLRVAWNAIAVVVHRDNPVATRRLTVAELDGLFSTTRARGHANVQYWRDLGLQGRWSQQPISLYGHDASTSLYTTFQQRALGGGTFKPEVVHQPSPAAVVYAVGRDLNAIGYTSISFLTPAVAVVPLAVHPWQTAVSPTPGSILAQQYPLTLEVNLYLNWPPGSLLTAPLREMFRFLYSRQGQRIVAAHGYVPLPAAMATQTLQPLGLTVNQQRP